MIRPRRSRLASAVLLLACTLVVGCREERAHAPLAPREFHVAIVVLDACRADKMGCYGFERPTTPEIDALARDPDTVVFRNHYVQAPWTKPSTASLFTGLYTHQHGVLKGHDRRGRRGGPPEDEVYRTQILPDSHRTIAERMKDLGYHTFGVVKSQHLVERYGFAQGFDEYVPPGKAKGDEARVERFLDLARESPRKFFGYLHVNACHHPFASHERDAEYMRRFAIDYDEKARQKAGVDFTTADIDAAIEHQGFRLAPKDVRFLNLVYEAQLRRVDRVMVRPLIDGLRKSGLYDDTLLIVTADHGEELYDHEGYGHAHALWQELVRVPMLVKFPRGRRPPALGREVTRITRSIDVLPAVLDFAGAPIRAGLPGSPIFRGVFGEISVSQTPEKWALVAGEYKLIIQKGQARLFHLRGDPTEKNDLAAKEPERVRQLRAHLESLLVTGSATAPEADVRLSPEAEANLRALGYLR